MQLVRISPPFSSLGWIFEYIFLTCLVRLDEVGYVVFQVPSNILVTKIPAHYYLPTVELFWGAFTLGTAFISTYQQLVVMRFFVGLSATACYIGCLTVINS